MSYYQLNKDIFLEKAKDTLTVVIKKKLLIFIQIIKNVDNNMTDNKKSLPPQKKKK